MSSDEIKVPEVFISYSQDSPEHNDRVLALSNRLRADGLHCFIDQYEDSPREGWQRWMEHHIQEADFVLIICTARYLCRVNGEEKPDVENGVRWESVIIYQDLYDAGTLNTKFIPVLFEGASPSDIPISIKSATRYILIASDDYNRLYRRLTNQPLIRKPKTGELRKLPSRDLIDDFLFSKSEPALKNPEELLTRDSGDTCALSEQTSEMQGKSKDIKRHRRDSQHGIGQLVASKQQMPMTEHQSKQVLSKSSPDTPFLEKAHFYIKEAIDVVKAAQTSLTAGGYIRPVEYSTQFDFLNEIKKSIEEFRDLIDKTLQLPEEITLGQELLRVKVNTAIGYIEEAKSCIEDFASPCQNIEQKFETLSNTLDDLGMHCKIDTGGEVDFHA